MSETPDIACPPRVIRPCERQVAIVDAAWITPVVRRITFGADGLSRDFATPAGAHAPYLKLLLGPADALIVRTYSIRRLALERDEIDVDFVLHEGPGPGSAFGRQAQRGDVVRLRGPGHLAVAACRHHHLFADHCGLPALAHLLEHLPVDATGQAFVEVPDEAEIQAVRAPAGVDVEWLVRKPGTSSGLAACAMRCARPSAETTLVWAGAEAGIARAIRSAARHEWAIPPRHCQVLNYWKSGRPEGAFSFIV